MQAVMISCQQRTGTREATLSNLAQAGVHDVRIHLSTCQPATPGGTLEAARALLTSVTPQPVLFLEDDLLIDKSLFGLQLPTAREADVPTYLYVTDRSASRVRTLYPRDIAERIITGQPLERELVILRQRRFVFGTLCVYLPAHSVETLQRAFARNARNDVPFDVFLPQTLRDGYLYTTVPHPVQHAGGWEGKTGDRSAWEALVKRQVSWSYGRDWL